MSKQDNPSDHTLPGAMPEHILEQISKIATDPETKAMLIRLNEIKQNCTKMLEEIYEKSHLSGKLVEKRLNDLILKQLPGADTSSYEETRKNLDKKLLSIFGQKVIRKQIEEKDIKDSKIRKGKTRGARNNWIPM